MSKKGRLGLSEKEVILGRSMGKREEMTEEEAINSHNSKKLPAVPTRPPTLTPPGILWADFP